MSWNKTTEKKDKQRKDMEETLIYLTEHPLHTDFDFYHLCYCLCFNPDDDIIISLYLFDYFVSICVPSSLCFPSLSLSFPSSLSLSCCSCPFPLSSESLPANECHKALGPNTIRRPSQAHPTHQPPSSLIHTHTHAESLALSHNMCQTR